jgi:hypothetical protein
MFRLRRALQARMGTLPAPIAAASYAFPDFDAYGDATYGKTMMALRTLENMVGRDRFESAFAVYARTWAFKHPTGDDLFATLRDQLGEDIAWFVGPAFSGVGAPELAVRSARCRPVHKPRGVVGEGEARKTVTALDAPDTGAYTCDVLVVNTGAVPVSVDVDIRFADDSHQREHWDARDGSHWHRFTLERSSTIVEVELDPDHKILLGDAPSTWDYRLNADSRASWRAAARVGFWAQTSMSVFGL